MPLYLYPVRAIDVLGILFCFVVFLVIGAGEKTWTRTKEYTYLNSGYVGRTKDNTTGKTAEYSYDLAGRVTGSTVYTEEGPAAGSAESEVQYTCGTGGHITAVSVQEEDGTVRKTKNQYDWKGTLQKTVLPDAGSVSASLTYTEDSLKRSSSVKLETGTKKTDVELTSKLSYLTVERSVAGKDETTETDFADTYTNFLTARDSASGTVTAETGTAYSYTYDRWGNLSSVQTAAAKKNGKTLKQTAAETVTERSYTYDAHSQVTGATEGNGTESKKYSYTYDKGGNITQETAETVKKGKTVSKTTHTYSYAAKGWKDQLLSYKTNTVTYDGNGKEKKTVSTENPVTYDVMGRPVNYMGDTMEWTYAGLLSKVTASGNSTLGLSAKSSAEFTYNADGARTAKTVSIRDTNGKVTSRRTTEYRYNNGMLLSETKGSAKLRYNYDTNGRVVSLVLANSNGTELSYFLSYNGQGDVVAVYRSSDGVLMGTYEYDLWGKPVKTTRTEADKYNITERNPIRYRSYYYDTETGLYYLNARYYDPTVRRFLNADSPAFMGGGDAVSYNLYAYCGNNPVNRMDPSGHYSGFILAEGVSCGTGMISVLYSAAMTGIAVPEPVSTIVGCLVVAILLCSEVTVSKTEQPLMKEEEDSVSSESPQNTGSEVKPEAAVKGSKKHGVKWKEGPARAKSTGNPQGQWAEGDLDYASQMANTLKPGESGYFDMPEGSESIVHMPDGSTQSATRMWIRNNGTGTWHGYPMP